MTKRSLKSILALMAGSALALALLWLGETTTVQAFPVTRYVAPAPTGDDQGGSNSCMSSSTPCATIQHAIDMASADDNIHVAGGTFAPIGTVAWITKSLMIQGGYAPDFSVHDPGTYKTVFDALWSGSVVRISNAGEVTLHLLTLTHGDGIGNCGAIGCGGGIYATGTNLLVEECSIIENRGTSAGGGNGGGIYVYGNNVNVLGSRIVSNTASISATISSQYGNGGGIFVDNGTASLIDNDILGNVGSVYFSGSGGIHLANVPSSQVLSNTIEGNKACLANYWCSGGGIHVASSDAYIAGNHIEGNWAGYLAGYGGGIRIYQSQARVDRNHIISNTTGSSNGYGGGVSIQTTRPTTLSNNLIALNYAASYGGGVEIWHSVPASQATLVNNTIADNGEHGVAAREYVTLTMINNIIAGHSIGFFETNPTSTTTWVDHNLFWNTSDPNIGTNAIQQNPLLLPDYHLDGSSPAIDRGVPTWVTSDIDGEARPNGCFFDIGFDEFITGLGSNCVRLPLVLRNY